MTKKLEEILEVSNNDDSDNSSQKKKEKADKSLKKSENQKSTKKYADDVKNSIPDVKNLGDATDEEFDEVAEQAMEAYKQVFDVGMNSDPRHSARLFEIAGNMLKTNLDAKSEKANKKIKVLEQQLKKQKQDQDESKKKSKNNEKSEELNSDGYVVADRNSLLEKIKGMDENNSNTDDQTNNE